MVKAGRWIPWATAILLGACNTLPPSPPPPGASVAPTPVISPTPPPPLSEADCVSGTVGHMSVEALAGQVIMVGTKVGNIGAITAAIGQYRPAGVFLAGRTTQPAASLTGAIAQLQAAGTAAGTRLMIGVDQEGGTVQTLGGTDFPPIASAVQQGKLSTLDLRAQATDWAARLKQAGITLDLAPVADVVPASLGDANKPIGALDREYGDNPPAVAQDIAVVVSAMQVAGVRATLKHFPGLGRVQGNTDTVENVVDNVTTVDDPFLTPFSAGITAGADAVMISLAIYPRIDSKQPAVFSHAVITDLLRGRLGFNGLIISDDLGNAVAVSEVPVGQRATRFIEAGGSLILTVTQSTLAPMVSALVQKAKGSTAFATQLRSAAASVLHSKYRAGLLDCSAAARR